MIELHHTALVLTALVATEDGSKINIMCSCRLSSVKVRDSPREILWRPCLHVLTNPGFRIVSESQLLAGLVGAPVSPEPPISLGIAWVEMCINDHPLCNG